jgi:guanylate kinase
MPGALPDDFLMLIVSSPSGAGKTTLCSRLRQAFPDLRFSVSHTTRAPRANETEGVEYHFVDQPRFEKMVDEGRFAEWAKVHGHFYGTSKAEIDQARVAGAGGILFDIDFQGARQIRASYPDAVGVFILPPSIAELERRLSTRGTETAAVMLHRLNNAKREITHYGLFDYVVVNDRLDDADRRLQSIVRAERCRRQRHARRCEELIEGIKSEDGT